MLYVLDGQNAFDTCTGYQGHEWTLDKAATRLITGKAIPPIIIVAIDNAGARRANEYLPYADPFNPAAGQMEGGRLAAFLSQDVMPAVAVSGCGRGSSTTALGRPTQERSLGGPARLPVSAVCSSRE